MKKMSFALVAAMFLSGTSFADKSYSRNENCREYAEAAVIAEVIAYGDMPQDEIDEAANFYYDACVESGGNIENPIFL